ncbi:MAG: Gfo/Idh/MocA family protein [Candidatus Zipacnadales bacterium]
MAEVLHIGFVGCGSHATHSLYPCLRWAPVDLAAVTDLDEVKAGRTARQFGARRAYTDYRRMMDEMNLEAVFVCGPPELHRDVALEAIDRGLHVWMEKPPTPTLEDTQAIAELAARKTRFVQVGFMKRFAPAYVQLKRLIESEEFGRPGLIEGKYCCWNVPDHRHHLIYYGVHLIDLFRFLMGEIGEIQVRKCDHGGQLANAILLRFVSGAVGLMNFSSRQPRVQERVEITGEGTVAIVDNRLTLEYHKRGDNRFGNTICWRPDFAIPNLANNTLELQGYLGEVRHFAESILRGEKPSPSIEDGVRCMEIVDQIETAAPC